MQTFEVPVAAGDVLVLATDGVYDNLYEREIVDLVVSGRKKGIEPTVSFFSCRNSNSIIIPMPTNFFLNKFLLLI